MMASLARAFALALLLGTTACALDEVPPGGGSGSDDRDTVLDIKCNASFTTSGTFTIGMAQPADIDGCWPVGVWSFSAAMDANECDPAPEILPRYEFRVDSTLDAEGNPTYSYAYLTDPSVHYRLKVSSGGGGLCEGGLEIYSADGKQYWNFKPALNADHSLTGFGEYALYNSDQWN